MNPPRKASYCDECKHYQATTERPLDVCAIGHKPRFYMPKTLSEAHTDCWGWKRRCSDFEKRTT